VSPQAFWGLCCRSRKAALCTEEAVASRGAGVNECIGPSELAPLNWWCAPERIERAQRDISWRQNHEVFRAGTTNSVRKDRARRTR
jgi:hypothetical protein